MANSCALVGKMELRSALWIDSVEANREAAGVATGVRREFDTVMKTQAERILRDLDVVQREEFEAVKEMARLAREENEALKARIATLEAKLRER